VFQLVGEEAEGEEVLHIVGPGVGLEDRSVSAGLLPGLRLRRRRARERKAKDRPNYNFEFNL